ncbi:S8 family serine peptidase [candidate division KSB1 bacterium]|nr:S8 family serine peptidase [candidate division KSB1 bacterium]
MKIKNAFIFSLMIIIFNTNIIVAGELSNSEYQKLDPRLTLIITNPEMKSLVFNQTLGKTSIRKNYINVFIKTSLTRPEINNLGGKVYSKVGDIVTCSIPIAMVEKLVVLAEVKYIQCAKMVTIKNDLSMPEIGVPQIRSEYDLTGKGVIIGIVDTGIDWKHLDFRNSDGTTRIKALLDFSDPGDTNGDDILDGSGPFGGTLYSEAQINAALNGSGTISEDDVVGHGTHVAGSAAGNGNAAGNGVQAHTYVGVAPEADLVIIKATRTQGSRNFVDADYINALVFIDSVANALNKAYVVNLSLGGSEGPHDGKDLSEQAIDNLIGPGIKGKAVVISAGNDGDKAIHSSGTFSSSVTKYETEFNIPTFTPNNSNMDDYVIFEGWYDASQSYKVKIFTPGNNIFGPVSSGNEFGKDTDEGAVFISNAKGGPSNLNGDKQIQIQVYDYSTDKTPKPGTWKVIIEGSSGTFNLWLAGSSMDASLTSNIDYSMIVGTPGTAFNAVTVGAYITKNKWTDLDDKILQITSLVVGKASDFSSPGPSRDGRTKPEICAPGEMITASYSSDAPPGSDYTMFNTGNSQYPNGLIASDGAHALSQGTSFAAPHVAGTIALMFQQNPNIDAIQARDAIINTAKADGYTSTVPSGKWGYGKLDAFSAVQYLSANPPEDKLSLSIFQNPAFTQYIDFYLITKYPLQNSPTASIQFGSDTPEIVSMSQLENLLYKGEYVFTRNGTAALKVIATIQGESESTLTKYFTVKMLKASLGGEIALEKMRLIVPQNAIHSDCYFTIFSEDDLTGQSNLHSVGIIYQLSPVNYSFDQEVNMRFSYDDDMLFEQEESGLSIYVFQNNLWTKIKSDVCLRKNVVSCKISQLGKFRLMYDPHAEISNTLPASYKLFQNYPNPFNANTNISYYLQENTDVKIEVFNIKGDLIKTLFNNHQIAGSHNIKWDGKDLFNNSVASGIFFYKLSADQFSQTQKMLFLK